MKRRPRQRYTRQKAGFSSFAHFIAQWAGRPVVFLGAVAVILIWVLSGPVFGFSDTWQLVINTGTTIITFLMVFLIQHTQNRESHAIHLKLDELIRATKGAHTTLLDIEEMSEEELLDAHARYEALAAKARKELRKGGKDTGIPDIEFH